MRSPKGNNTKYTMIFHDYINLFEGVDHAYTGLVFQKILHYANDRDFDISHNELADHIWRGIKNQMDRDLGRYDNKIAEDSKNGQKSALKRYHKDLYDKVEAKEMTLNEALIIVKQRKESKVPYKKAKDPYDILSNTKTNTNTKKKNNTNIEEDPF